jgi:hypothetical protein
VRTEGTISNRDGIGAFVKAIPDMDHPETFQVREITSGDSYLVQSEQTVHFGLGEFSGPIDLIEVYWPASGITQHFIDVPINSTLLVKERLPGDYNDDLAVDAADYILWRNSQGTLGANLQADGSGTANRPDGIVDQWDYTFWKTNFGVSLPSSRITPGSGALVAAVPEPTTAALIVISAICISRRNRTFSWPSHEPQIRLGTAP